MNDLRRQIYGITTSGNISLPEGSFPGFAHNDFNISDLELKESFDIVEFKTRFNRFLKILNDDILYYLDELLNDFKKYDKFSKMILYIIYKGVRKLQYQQKFDETSESFRNIEHHIREDAITSADMKIYADNLWLQNKNNLLTIREYNIYPNSDTSDTSLPGGPNNIHQYYWNLGLFEFYNYLVILENSDPGNVYERKLKDVGNDVRKYYFFTEILLKILSDTEMNVTPENSSKIIKRNYNDNYVKDYQNNNEEGLSSPHSWSLSSDLSNNNSCSQNSAGLSVIPVTIENLIKNKLLSNIYLLVMNINQYNNDIRDDSYILSNSESIINRKENIINDLNNDKDIYGSKITTLSRKQNEIKKINRIDFIKMLLMLLMTLIFIGMNINLSLKGEQSMTLLLQMNLIVIVIIFIMKFYYLLK